MTKIRTGKTFQHTDMPTFQRILVPLDGSRLAESALPFTVVMAECLKAKVMLLHIIEERAPQTVHGEPHLTSARQAEAYLRGVAERYAGHVEFEQHVHGTEEHNVAQSIASHVDEEKADMVALCTHGRGGLRRVVYGSIAQQVLKRVDVPVLLARPNQSPKPDNAALKTILVPIDSEHPAESALSVAVEIASACDAQLYLVSVVPTVETVTGDMRAASQLTPIATAEALDFEEEQSKDSLEQAIEQLGAQGIQATALVRRGNTVPSLAGAIGESQADLVVIATHARSGLDAFLTGSVAATLAGKVTKPLLMVRI